MLRWILNDKDTCSVAIEKMVAEAKKLAEMIESENVGRELNIPAEKVNTTKEMRETLKENRNLIFDIKSMFNKDELEKEGLAIWRL